MLGSEFFIRFRLIFKRREKETVPKSSTVMEQMAEQKEKGDKKA
jgi:hypothetical protein